MTFFTTIGPMNFENYAFTYHDPQPNPGDRVRLELTLKNNSATAIATNIKAGLISFDPLVSVSDYSVPFDPIPAGENSTSTKTFIINISEECPVDTVVPIIVNISIDDHICWSDTFSITILEPTNLEDIREPLTRIYPNPTDNILTIEISNTGKQEFEIEILTIAGQVIYRKEYNNINASFTGQIDLSDYIKGVYLVKVRQADRVYVGKVVVR
jgi:hypothetical protein